MITALAVIIASAIIALEGWLLTRLLWRDCSRSVAAALAYPAGLLLHTLLFFTLLVAGVGWTPLGGSIGHSILLACLIVGRMVRRPHLPPAAPADRPADETVRRSLSAVRIPFLVAILLPAAIGVGYALLFPTYYWDTFTNWHMRALQMADAGRLIADGMAKPQYPILHHATTLAHTLLTPWSDRAANASTLLISLTAGLGIAPLLRRRSGLTASLATLAVLLSLPLLSPHLRQGYAEIHVIAFSLLSALLLAWWRDTEDVGALRISALLVSAAAWTKLEGMHFALVPWLLIAAWIAWRDRAWRTVLPNAVLPTLLISAIWPAYVLANGLPLTPHGVHWEWHIDVLPQLLRMFTAAGSFGMHAFFLILLVTALFLARSTKALRTPAFLWGCISLAFVTGTYLFTADASGLETLVNAPRAFLLPASLLIVGLVPTAAQLVFDKAKNPSQ
ncbi:MAG: hypothetical protein G01um101425_21 [Candidatus Peregrinibacteria bacterium Gr01-1014_25]|nr:MAG: hypothetical protein G01um101425_21 [Candidatus Peregrinibacteria bacterium Gr01-1014_25]